MAQYFNHFPTSQHNSGGGIDPNDIAMSGSHSAPYLNNNFGSSSNGFSSGMAGFNDDELEELNSPQDSGPSGLHHHGQDFSDLGISYASPMYPATSMNGFSSTPDGDPLQSPFMPTFGTQQQFRQIQHQHQHQHQPFGASVPYNSSPVPNNTEMGNDGKVRPRLSSVQAQAMQRKPSSNPRSPLTPGGTTNAMASLTVGSHESAGFGAQPIRTPNAHHDKSPPGQWIGTGTPKSMSSFPGSLGSPLQHGFANPHLAEVVRQGGASVPARINPSAANLQSQEAKKKRRRESHNAVERRRRDNINERIQDLSKLVPGHRLEDEKVKKLLTNGTPLSPNLTGASQPGQATSGLAGPGAKRATGVGNITTGLPVEDKDKGPNKGDILNGAVSWTRDLMWMLHVKIQQQEELINHISELGGHFPLELTEDEKRMQTELMEAMSRNDALSFGYTRYNGSGLRVPNHTDYRGDPLDGAPLGSAIDNVSVSPEDHNGDILVDDLAAGDQFWSDPNDDVKEEDEYSMDLN